jgi:hypothetical protein
MSGPDAIGEPVALPGLGRDRGRPGHRISRQPGHSPAARLFPTSARPARGDSTAHRPLTIPTPMARAPGSPGPDRRLVPAAGAFRHHDGRQHIHSPRQTPPIRNRPAPLRPSPQANPPRPPGRQRPRPARLLRLPRSRPGRTRAARAASRAVRACTPSRPRAGRPPCATEAAGCASSRRCRARASRQAPHRARPTP